MGLHRVSIVLDMEREFGICISDDEAASVETMGDIHALVAAKLPYRDVLLEWLLTTVHSRLGWPVDGVGPNTPISAMLEGADPKEAWPKLADALGLALPDLERPVAMDRRYQWPGVCVAIAGVVLAAVGALAHSYLVVVAGLGTAGASIVYVAAYRELTMGCRTCIPEGCSLVCHLLARVAAKLRDAQPSVRVQPPGVDRQATARHLLERQLEEAFSGVLGRPLAELDPSTPLQTLLPRKRRRETWDALKVATGWPLPRLLRSDIVDLLLAGPIALLILVGILVGGFGLSQWDMSFLVPGAFTVAAASLLYWVYDWATARSRVCFPRGVCAVGDLLRFAPLVPVSGGPVPDLRDPLWLRIRELVAEEAGVGLDCVTPDATWDDFGVD